MYDTLTEHIPYNINSAGYELASFAQSPIRLTTQAALLY